MSRVISGLVAILAWSSIAAAQIQTFQSAPGLPPPQAPPRDAAAKTGTAVIRGHVFDAGSGRPLRKALVRAFSPELRENRIATTDANGAYELKELAAGRYQLNASKGSFVQLQYGQLRPFEPGKPLEVANAQTIEKIDFNLPRGGIITGRILDEFGEPVSDVQVMAMRYQYIQGRRQLSPAGRPMMTNDIGEYRVFALPPGQYFLSATLRNLGGLDGASDDRSGYAATYYPGSSNVSDAQRVTIGVGQTVSDLNFALSPTRMARISGTVSDSAGKPPVGAFIMMMQVSGAFMASTTGAQVRPDGSFSINNVSPGDYIVRANVAGLNPSAELMQSKITVTGEDITGLVMTGVKPSTITGRVSLPESANGGPSLTGVQLLAVASTPELFSNTAPARVGEDGSFEIKVTPGNHLIRLNALGPLANTRIKTVRLNGVDVTDTGIESRPNEDLDGLQVELTTQLSDVSGFVSNARGENARDYTVVMFSRDPQRWGFASRYLGGGRPDQDGRFRVRNLPGGEYYAIALDYVEQGAGTDPEFLERIKDRATEFSLNDGETKTLSLKLITGT